MFYLAYGSNLHPLRLTRRVPSARLISRIKLLGYSVVFNKLSEDHSAKCNLESTHNQQSIVYTALYHIDPAHKVRLDHFEGLGKGYTDGKIVIEHDNKSIDCFTYFAQDSHRVEDKQPYHWYKQLVLQGAHFLRFPRHYVRYIEGINSCVDPNRKRAIEMQTLLQEMQQQTMNILDRP